MSTHNKARTYAIITIGILCILLLCLCFLLVREYQRVHRLEDDHAPQFLQLVHGEKRPLTATDATSISSWMTFDFINHIFHLPSNYLQNALQITDSKYPDISIDQYARTHGFVTANVLEEVQVDVATYLYSQTTTQ